MLGLLFAQVTKTLGVLAVSATCVIHIHPCHAIEAPNVIMSIDGMATMHQGLFRTAGVNDKSNTFIFGGPAFQVAPGSIGRYHSFFVVDFTSSASGGITSFGRIRSSTPEAWTSSDYVPVTGLDLTSDYYSILDRGAFGAMFDPDDYQVEVKFQPNQISGLPTNEAATFEVQLDQGDGFVFDAEIGLHKRAAEQFVYTIGSEAIPINTWYATAPKDSDGFATWTVPVTTPSFARVGQCNGGPCPYEVLAGDGRTDNLGTWSDVIDGPDFDHFGGPSSSLKAPNGLSSIGLASAANGPDALRNLSIEVKTVAVKRTNPTSRVARIDADSGITHRFGTGFTYGNGQPPLNVEGIDFLPPATDQISRFDEDSMTNLVFNMRTPDNPQDVHRFLLRDAPEANSFDGSFAMVNIRARLLESNTASTLRIVAKDLDGNDTTSDPVGADEYTFEVDLGVFNTSTFTTISIPLSEFALSTFVSGMPSSGPFGFDNPGDSSLTEFNLYEFGGLIPADSGLLRMELEYLEILVPTADHFGDFDFDGDVDGRDFLAWQRGESSNPPSASDLEIWQDMYGAGLVGNGFSVPEPTTAILLATGLLLAIRRR